MSNKKVGYELNAVDKTASGINSAVSNLQRLDKDVSKVTKSFDIIKNSVVVGIGIQATKAVASFVGSCVSEFAQFELSNIKLRAALQGNETTISQMGDLVTRLGSKSLATNSDLESLIAELAQLGKSPKEIEKITEASVILSEVTGGDLQSAFTQLNGTFAGTAGKLTKLIPELGNLTKQQLENGDAVQYVIDKMGKYTDSVADSYAVKVKNLGEAFNDLKKTLGRGWAEAFKPMVDEAVKAVKAVTDEIEKGMKAQQSAKSISAITSAVNNGNKDEAVKLAKGATLPELQQAFELAKASNPMGTDKQLAALSAIESILRSKATISQASPAQIAAGKPKETNPIVEDKEWEKFIEANRVGWREVDTGIEEYAQAVWDMSASFNDSATSLIDNLIPLGSGGDTGIAEYKPTLGEQAGAVLQGQKDNAAESFSPMFDIIGQLSGAFGPLVTVFEKLSPLINWSATIMQGVMEVLGPLLDSLLKPLIGILKIVGQTIGKMLAPALQLLMPIITGIAKLFVWLYNGVFVPIYNAIKWVENMIVNGFIAFANGILAIIDSIPFVNVGRISYIAQDSGFLDKISMEDVNTAGATGTTGSSGGSSASYAGARDITVNIYYDHSYVNGDTREIALNLRQEIRSAEALGY